jgi:hypothetical protein
LSCEQLEKCDCKSETEWTMSLINSDFDYSSQRTKSDNGLAQINTDTKILYDFFVYNILWMLAVLQQSSVKGSTIDEFPTVKFETSHIRIFRLQTNKFVSKFFSCK